MVDVRHKNDLIKVIGTPRPSNLCYHQNVKRKWEIDFQQKLLKYGKKLTGKILLQLTKIFRKS